MYNLLIVDDESIIVDSYYELLEEHFTNQLNINKAYTSETALALAKNNRIDILITDIVMPILDGYQLQKNICAIWPKCRVIFLTGYADINNVQKAIRSSKQIIDYVLKLEDDKVFLQAVRNAIDSIDNEIKAEDLVMDIQKNMAFALPVLRKEFFINLLNGNTPIVDNLSTKFNQYQLDFNPDMSVIILCAMLSEGENNCIIEDYTANDVAFFAINNILKQYLDHYFNNFGLKYNNKFIWLFQPNNYFINKSETETVGYIYSFLDIVQDSCSRLFNITVNFSLSRKLWPWNKISPLFKKLSALLEQNRNLQDSILFLEDVAHNLVFFEDIGKNIDNIFYSLEESLLAKDIVQCEENLKKIVYFMVKSKSLFARLHFEICSVFSRCMKTLELQQPSYDKICGMLMDMKYFTSFDKLISYYTNIAKTFIKFSWGDSNKVTAAIKTVIEYIDNHINGDLSLTTVSSMVHHNPTYFSKLFKRTMNVGFCEYVINQRMKKARELIVNTDMKIKDIALAVGYESVPYFIRTFKRILNVTPQEFRNKYLTREKNA